METLADAMVYGSFRLFAFVSLNHGFSADCTLRGNSAVPLNRKSVFLNKIKNKKQ